MSKLTHLFKYTFSKNYRYECYKTQKDKDLAEEMAAHPEDFHEDEYWIWETQRNNKGEVIGCGGKLKGAPPPVSPEIKKMFEDIALEIKNKRNQKIFNDLDYYIKKETKNVYT